VTKPPGGARVNEVTLFTRYYWQGGNEDKDGKVVDLSGTGISFHIHQILRSQQTIVLIEAGPGQAEHFRGLFGVWISPVLTK